MASSLVAVTRSPMTGLYADSMTKGGHTFVTQKVIGRNNQRMPSRLTIRCLKGAVAPAEWEKLIKETKLVKETNGVVPVTKPILVNRLDFPADFYFGCSTSALQTEGNGTEGGRGPGTWDMMLGGQNAVDSYNRYKEDVQILKQMGATAYRLSISWSRILPDGTVSGGINQEGIDFYNNFINELLSNGITPIVTLFHFDLPQALQNKYKGFLNSQIVEDFKAYADICFKNFGDRVTHWTTINEPQVFAQYGFSIGMPSDYQSTIYDGFVAGHNILLCHGAACQLYKEKYKKSQGGQIGISAVVMWFEPLTHTSADMDACQRAFDFLVGWMIDPLISGDYPFIMRALVGDKLPKFTEKQKAMVKQSCDFIGVNYYTSKYAESVPFTGDEPTSFTDFQHANLVVEKNGVPIGPPTSGSDQIYIYPSGLTEGLKYLQRRYHLPTVYVTENGYPDKRDDSLPIDRQLVDDFRIQHIIDHLNAIAEARKAGINVRGYFMWALMDCMEVGSGYDVRFGLFYTDYNNLNRTAKKSAKWFKTFMEGKTPRY